MNSLLQDWQYVRTFDSNSQEVRRFRDRLRLTVGRDYPWLCAELFELEGDLGWGPGFREDEEELFPPAKEEAPAKMTTFLNTLAGVEKDPRLIHLLMASKGDMPNDKACDYLNKCRKGFQGARMGELIRHFYGRLARRDGRWTYTLGAARIYVALWEQQGKFWLALAGLINLSCKGLTKANADAETVQRKYMRIRKLRLPLNQQAESRVALRAC